MPAHAYISIKCMTERESLLGHGEPRAWDYGTTESEFLLAAPTVKRRRSRAVVVRKAAFGAAVAMVAIAIPAVMLNKSFHPCEFSFKHDVWNVAHVCLTDTILFLMVLRVIYTDFVAETHVPGNISWGVFMLCQMVNVTLAYIRSRVVASDALCGRWMWSLAVADIVTVCIKIVVLMSFYTNNDMTVVMFQRTVLGITVTLLLIPSMSVMFLKNATSVNDLGLVQLDWSLTVMVGTVGVICTAFVVMFLAKEAFASRNFVRKVRLLLYSLGIVFSMLGQLLGFLSLKKDFDLATRVYFSLLFLGASLAFVGTELTNKRFIRAPIMLAVLVSTFLILIAVQIASTENAAFGKGEDKPSASEVGT